MNTQNRLRRSVRLANQLLSRRAAPAGRNRERGPLGGILLLLPASLFSTALLAAPQGGEVTAGSGAISQSGATTTIEQASQNLSLSWQSFNVAPTETVNFKQPNSSALAVNRIADTSGSRILGQLNANGQVYLINPNGVLFGAGAQVNVGGIVASTLDTADNSTFAGESAASVVNNGTINAEHYVALLGNSVANTGIITAQLGTVAMGAGSEVTLSFSGNELVQLRVDESVIETLVANHGLVKADGGRVFMTAGARDALRASVVNHDGIAEAQTVENRNGTIVLLGGMAAGTVNVAGTLDASAPEGGDGGFVETSAAHVDIGPDALVTTLAPGGEVGEWLIDPQDYTVAASGGDMTGAALTSSLGSTSVTLMSSAGSGAGGGDININDAVSWSANTLTLTAARDVNINAVMTATGSASLAMNPATGNGGDAAVAGGTVNVGMDGSTFTGRVDFNSSGTLTIGGTPYTVIHDVGVFQDTANNTLQGMNNDLAGHYVLGSDIDASITSTWNGGKGFTPIATEEFPGGGSNLYEFTGIFDGLGHSISGLTNKSNSGYQGVFSYTLGAEIRNVGLTNVDISGANQFVGGLVGWLESSRLSNSFVTGTVSNPGSYTGGVLGYNKQSTVSNIYSAATLNGYFQVGGLVGFNEGLITDSSASGDINGNTYVGGLTGINNGGTFTDSFFSSGSVDGVVNVGGLIGWDISVVNNSFYDIDTTLVNGAHEPTLWGIYGTQFADWQSNNLSLDIADYAGTLAPGSGGYYEIGSVQGLKDMLGFLGDPATNYRLTSDIDLGTSPGFLIPLMRGHFDGANHTLSNLLLTASANEIGMFGIIGASGTVSNLGVINVDARGNGAFTNPYNSSGGIAGYSKGVIENSYATGAVLGVSAGGLVGRTGTGSRILDSYSDVVVSNKGMAAKIGGLVAQSGGVIENSHALGSVTLTLQTGGEVTAAGGLVGIQSGGAISNSYAAGDVTGGRDAGGLVGLGKNNTQISDSYATGSVSQGGTSGGLVGTLDTGTISGSHATGNVTSGNGPGPGWGLGSIYAGGLVGGNWGGDISDSYATGDVSSTTDNTRAGGLVAYNIPANTDFIESGGSISSSYATGNVSAFGDGSMAGGLVGDHGLSPALRDAFGSIGGAPLVSYATISNSYATGNVSASGIDTLAGGLVGDSGGLILNSYSAGAVTGATTLGGFAASTTNPSGGISNSFFDSSVNAGMPGIAVGIDSGATGMSSLQMQQQANFTSATAENGNVDPAWDFSGTWFMYEGKTTPLLRTFMTPLTVTADAATGTYSGTAYSGGLANAVYSVAGADTSGHILNLATAYGNAILPGTYSVDLWSDQQGYILDLAIGDLTIGKAPLTVTANNAGKTYDGLAYSGNNGVNFQGFVNGETAAVLGGSPVYGGNSQGAINAGNYAITASGYSSANYTITYADGQLTINPATLTYTANPAFMTYGGAVPSLSGSVTGFVAGETLASATTGTASFTTAATGSSNVGSYAIDGAGLTANGGNYVFAQAAANATALTINPAPLVVSANPDGKVYDGLAYSGGNGVVYSGFVNGETTAVLGGSLSYGGSSQGAINAGNYVIAPGGLTATNYAISYTNAVLGITTAPLSVSANNDGKTYDGLAYNGGNGVVYNGFVNGETSAVLGGAVTYGGNSQGAVDAGNYAITPGGLSSNNYNISYLDGQLSVAPAPLMVTANDAGKTYDGLAYSGGNGVSYSGLVNGETEAVLGGALTYSGSSQGAIDVGDYVITPGGLSSGNYLIDYSDGMLTVNPAALTVTANDAGKIYDGAAWSGGNGVTYSGLVNGETEAVLGGALTYSGSSQGAIDVGDYVITPGGLTSGNYTIAYADGLLAIDKALLTITANNSSKTYDGKAYRGGNGVRYSGFAEGDGVSSLDGSLIYLGSSQGAVDAGTYAISPGGMTGKNYTIIYVDGELAIGAAQLAITAIDASKTYDGLAWSGGNGVSYSGFIGDDTEAVLDGALTWSGDAQGAVNAGSYAITPGGLDSDNYSISFIDGQLTVDPAALSVIAKNASKTYDGLAWSGGNGVTYSGFVNGENEDVLGGALGYFGNSQGAVDVGTYVLTPGGLASDNYVIAYTDGSLTVDPARLTITANDIEKFFNGLAHTGASPVSYSGFVDGESPAVLQGTLSFAGTSQGATGIGDYTITPGGLGGKNYLVDYVDGTLKIRAFSAAGLIAARNSVQSLLYEESPGTSDTAALWGRTDQRARSNTVLIGDRVPMQIVDGGVALPTGEGE